MRFILLLLLALLVLVLLHILLLILLPLLLFLLLLLRRRRRRFLLQPPPRGLYDSFPRPLFFCMLPRFPDHLNSPGHRFWMGWWGYAKRQEIPHLFLDRR